MALSNIRQWDQYEHPMPEHLEQERVLNAIDQLFEESNLFNLSPEKRFPDLIERSTAAVRESVQQALDENRGLRIDKPTEAHPDEPMSQQILKKSEDEKRAEAFGHGVRGWLRKLFNKPRREAEFMLPPEGDDKRGIRTFTRREVLGATYFLEPERAERIIGEKMKAEADEKDKGKRHITNMMDLLEKRLGVNVWNERQAYPGIRFAMAFIANLILHPPKDDFGAEDVKKFVEAALGGEVEYEKTVREAKQAESNYKLMESKINKAETHVNDLMKLAEELKKACQGTNFKDKKIDLENEIDILKSGEKIVVVSLEKLKKDKNKALKEASGKKDDPRFIEANRELEERGKRIRELRKKLAGSFGPRKTMFEKQLKVLMEGEKNFEKPSIEKLYSNLDTALKNSGDKETTAVINARKELAERENEIKTKEEELNKLKSLQKSIGGERALLKQFIGGLEKSEVREEMLKFIQNEMSTNDEAITDTTNKLIAYKLSDKFEAYASELRAKLKSELETKKAEKEKALKAAEEVKDVKLTPDELVYKLFWHYFTTKQEKGGFLDDNIPDHWIAKQNVSFHNNLRDRALLATRFAISEAKDQAVFAQLYANRGLAQHELAQRTNWGRFMEHARSSWLGNKIATTFGRPEQASFNKILERIRTVETTKDGQPHYPFANLELKWITTRGDLRKAIDTKKLDENELPRLASYLEMILKESDKIEIRPRDAEMFYRTIRNLKLVRQEMVHKKFMDEVKKTPGSMPEKLRDLWQKKWAEEEAFDAQMTEEARKRNFIAFLEKEKFDATKKQIVAGIISDLRSDTIKVDEATKRLHDTGYKVGRLSGLGLWSGAQMQGLGEVTKKGIKATPVVIFKTLGFIGRKSVVPLKWLWGGIKQVGGDFKSTFEATAGIK